MSYAMVSSLWNVVSRAHHGAVARRSCLARSIRALAAAALLALSGALALPATAQAEVLLSNLGQSHLASSPNLAFGTFRHAQEFTTGSTVESLEVRSWPQRDGYEDVYGFGETIVFTLTFSQRMRVKGDPLPTLAFDLGGTEREARFYGLSDTDFVRGGPRPRPRPEGVKLHFGYTVKPRDLDDNGVAVGANAIRLGGARIRGAATGLDADLSHAAVGPLSDHKVDSGTAQPPQGAGVTIVDSEGNPLELQADGKHRLVIRELTRGRYGLKLNTRPTRMVYLHGIPSAGDEDLHILPNHTTLPSAPHEWETPIWVKIRAARDDDAVNGERVFLNRVHSRDPAYNDLILPDVLVVESDDDVWLSVANTAATEGEDEKLDFTVRLDGNPASEVTVDYATADGTATAGSDYTETSGTLTFAPGETEKTVSVLITDDDVEDDRETVLLVLSNASGATIADELAVGTIRNTEDPTALTASFSGLPAEHDGESGFRFRVAFSERIAISFRSLREDAFTVTGGRVTRGRRVNGRRDLFEITVRPDSVGDVTIALPAERSCGVSGPRVSGAICTKSRPRRRLTNAPEATVRGPVALSVADARAREGEDATIDFAVTLSRAASAAVSVAYATADGTATAGADYTRTSGKLRFAPGETVKTVSVPVLDDAHDEGEETFILRLSAASGAVIADGEATGTIENTDPLQRAWLARFGRTVAEQVLEAVGGRIEGKASAAQVTLGGREVALDAAWPGGEEALPASWSRDAASGRLPGEDLGREEKDPIAREMTMSELLLGSSFHLASAQGGGGNAAGRWSLWGRGMRTGFKGTEGALSVDGDVTTGIMGADYESKRMLVGVALAHSAGDGSYSMNDSKGEVESTLTGAYPYLRYRMGERLSLWGVVGLGEGEMRLTPEGGEEMEADLSSRMAALGARGELLTVAGYALAIKTDVLLVRTKSDAAAGLAAADARTRRLRLLLEASREVKFADSVLTPSVEAGLRFDGGDAETGTGVEVGGGIRWSNTRGLAVEIRARGLLAHEERDYEEWGVSASVVLAAGAGGRGLSMRVGSSFGAASSGVDRLWAQRAAAGGVFDPASTLDAEVAYGLSAWGGLLTPYTGLSVSEGGGTYRVGGRFKLGERFTMSLEGDRRENERDDLSHGVALRGSLHW